MTFFAASGFWSARDAKGLEAIMGSFVGHAIPGALFFFYGLLWSLNCIWYYHRTKSTQKASGDARTKREKFPSTSFFEFKRDNDLSKKGWIPHTFTRVPIEPLSKIIFPLLGVIVEAFFDFKTEENGRKHLVMTVYSPWDSKGELNNIGKLHHITMYGSFVLSGVVDLLTLFVRLPRQTSMLFLSFAFTVEGLLFVLHTGGRDELDVVIHTFLTYSIVSCVVFTLLRIINANNVVINICVGSSILLQGTWFVQAGYFLFGGFLDKKNASDNSSFEHSHGYVMFVAVCFTWHLTFIALANMVVWIIISAALRSRVCHRRTLRRRGLLANLRRGLQAEEDEERNMLIVEEANDEMENGIELQHMAETHT